MQIVLRYSSLHFTLNGEKIRVRSFCWYLGNGSRCVWTNCGTSSIQDMERKRYERSFRKINIISVLCWQKWTLRSLCEKLPRKTNFYAYKCSESPKPWIYKTKQNWLQFGVWILLGSEKVSGLKFLKTKNDVIESSICNIYQHSHSGLLFSGTLLKILILGLFSSTLM